jgi:hypothetical protein
MPDTTPLHIADSPERLEAFVLGRITDSEHEAVESHAAACDRCAQAIRSERMLAAGAKSLGRALLKERLRSGVAEPSLRIPWPRILSAVAVLLLLVGVGWLNHWFITPEQETMMLSDKLSRESEKALPQAVSPPAVASEAPPLADRDERAGAPAAGPAKEAEHPALRVEEKTQGLDASPALPSKEVADIAAAESRNAVVTRRDMKIAPASGGVWVEGNAIAEAPAAVRFRAGAKDALLKGKSDARTLAESETNALSGAGAAAPPAEQTFRVRQRTATALPALRQNVQQRNGPSGTIQTLLEQTSGETVLTLYLDSLRNPVDLRNARVQQVGRDSIIVNIGNQRIGYRLPGALQQEPVK